MGIGSGCARRYSACKMTTRPTDIIYLRELRVNAVIGIYEWEQRIRQTLSIDLEMAADIRRAAAADNIETALNYKAVAERVVAFVEGTQFQLIEALAERIASLLLDEFKIPWVRISLGKPGAVPGSRDVGVVIERALPGVNLR
jgi:7,8-dihydroneopterin aldolase/epimerase/oxygenase